MNFTNTIINLSNQVTDYNYLNCEPQIKQYCLDAGINNLVTSQNHIMWGIGFIIILLVLVFLKLDNLKNGNKR